MIACSRPRNVATHRPVPLEIKARVAVMTWQGTTYSPGKHDSDGELFYLVTLFPYLSFISILVLPLPPYLSSVPSFCHLDYYLFSPFLLCFFFIRCFSYILSFISHVNSLFPPSLFVTYSSLISFLLDLYLLSFVSLFDTNFFLLSLFYSLRSGNPSLFFLSPFFFCSTCPASFIPSLYVVSFTFPIIVLVSASSFNKINKAEGNLS